jgi:hypothetical protein
MNLLAFYPESLATINIISGYFWGKWPLVIIIGLLLLVLSLVLTKVKFGFFHLTNDDRLILLFVLFWLILSVNFLGNNYYNFVENQQYWKYDTYHRSIIRVCGIDGTDGLLCHGFALLTKLRHGASYNSLTAGSDPMQKTYIDYYYLPQLLQPDSH